MRVLEKTVISPTEPPQSDVVWAKPIGDGFALYLFDGIWKPMKIVNTQGTPSTDDDIPYEGGGGGQLGPNTVGTREIINNSIKRNT